MPNALTKFLDSGAASRRIMMGLVGIGALAVIWALAQWAMSPTMVTLFSQLPVESVSDMTSRLDEEDIAYRLHAGGSTLAVPEKDLARARVALAQSGFPAGGRPGWELFDEASWGMTDFTQRVNYRRALEGELKRTIEKMRGVENAQVHLAIQKSSILKESSSPNGASVVLALRSGAQPERAMVEGVASLVAGSVEGMEKENVTVLDDSGRLLSESEDDLGATGLTTKQLKIQQDFERYLEEKAYELVEPVVGRGNVTVRVAAAMDFDQLGRTVESFDLDQQFTTREDRSEIIPGSEDQGASSLTVNSIYEAPRTVETFARIGSKVDRLTVAVVVSDREEGDEASPSFTPRTPQELGRIESLVRSGLGIDQTRGDAVTVVSMPFDREPVVVAEEESGPDVIAIAQASVRPAIGILALTFAFILSLKLLRFMKTVPLGPGEERALAPPEGSDALPGDLAASRLGDGQRPAIASAGGTGRIELSDPNMTARVVKAWLSEE
jgi:flagellar M-ring protein FliF